MALRFWSAPAPDGSNRHLSAAEVDYALDGGIKFLAASLDFNISGRDGSVAAEALFEEVDHFNLRDAGNTRAIAVFATGVPLICSAQEAGLRLRRELLSSNAWHCGSGLPRAGRV